MASRAGWSLWNAVDVLPPVVLISVLLGAIPFTADLVFRTINHGEENHWPWTVPDAHDRKGTRDELSNAATLVASLRNLPKASASAFLVPNGKEVVSGLLLSDHAEHLKRAIFLKVLASTRPSPDQVEQSESLYLLAARLLLGPSDLETSWGEALLNHLGGLPGQLPRLAAFFSTRRLVAYFSDQAVGLAKVVNLVRNVLPLKERHDALTVRKDCHELHSLLAPLCKDFAAPALQVELARLFLTVRLSRPAVVDISKVAIRWLAGITAGQHAKPDAYNQHVAVLVKLLLNSWDNREDKMMASLVDLFQLISRNSDKGGISGPCFALANVLQNVPATFVATAAGLIAHPASQLPDHEIEAAILRIVGWPITARIGDWIVGLMKGLSNAKRYSIMCAVVAKSAHVVVNQMFIPELRRGAFVVLEFMLLGYQHSPNVFHMLLPSLLKLFNSVQATLPPPPAPTSTPSPSVTPSSPADQHSATTNGEVKANGAANESPAASTNGKESDGESEKKKQKVEADAAATPAAPEKDAPETNGTPTSATNGDITKTKGKEPEQADLMMITRAALAMGLTAFLNDRSVTHVLEVPIAGLQLLRSLLTLFETDDGEVKLRSIKGGDGEEAETRTWLTQLARLLHILVHQHGGYPELYTPLLQAIKEYPALSEAEMKQTLSERAWTAAAAGTWQFGEIRGKSGAGLAGLVNLGNTCYLNSFLQALFMTDPLREVLAAMNSAGQGGAASELQRVFAYLLRTQRHAHAPKSFLKVLPPWFRPGLQQDTSEFGKYLLDQLETDLTKVQTANPQLRNLVSNTFTGSLRNQILCKNCGARSLSSESFMELALSFDSLEEQTLDCMLRHYFLPELLEGDNRYFCSHCAALQDAEKSCKISKSPEHLVVTMKRFAYDVKTSTRTKILQDVRYPLTLSVPVLRQRDTTKDVSTSSSGADVEGKDKEKEKDNDRSVTNDGEDDVEEVERYGLYAVIMHSGTSANHGHYYAYSRHSNDAATAPDDEDETAQNWYLLNDSFVDRSSFRSFTGITKRFANDVAYVLFYRRKPPPSTFHQQVLASTAEVVTPHVEGDEVNAALAHEVAADNARFLVEQEQAARRRTRRTGYAYARSMHNHFGDDDDDDFAGSSCGGRAIDNDFGGRGGFGGGMPRFIS